MMLVDEESALTKKRYGSRQRGRPIDLENSAPIVIKKISWKLRKIPLSYAGHVRGWHPVRSGHGSIRFESLIERNTISELARSSRVTKIVSQPVTIEYSIGARKFRYTPDLLVEISSIPQQLADLGFGHQVYIECKPHDLVESESQVLDRHFSALRIALDAHIVLITDRDLVHGVQAVTHG